MSTFIPFSDRFCKFSDYRIAENWANTSKNDVYFFYDTSSAVLDISGYPDLFLSVTNATVPKYSHSLVKRYRKSIYCHNRLIQHSNSCNSRKVL